MNQIRTFLKENPAVAWAITLVAVGVAIYFAVFRSTVGEQFTPEYMTQMVTIRFADTGETMEIPRGRLIEQHLLSRTGTIDPSVGITNPKTGAATGFPYDKGSWERMIERVNRERDAAGAVQPSAAPGSPAKGG